MRLIDKSNVSAGRLDEFGFGSTLEVGFVWFVIS